MSFRVMWTFTRSPAGIGGIVASYAACALASSSAFAAVLPAKLSSGSDWFAVALRRMVVGRRRDAAASNLVARLVRCLRRDDGCDDERADRECEEQHDDRGERADALSAVAPTVEPRRAGRRVGAHLILLEAM